MNVGQQDDERSLPQNQIKPFLSLSLREDKTYLLPHGKVCIKAGDGKRQMKQATMGGIDRYLARCC
jgi:hypothetical protein